MRIPLTSKAAFEEVLDDFWLGDQPVNVEQVARLLRGSDGDVLVRLTEPSDDVVARPDSDDDHDLPCDASISLTSVSDEQCVLASLQTADSPAFHLPLRTSIDVRLVKYLDRRDSPFLCTDQRINRPRLSTMDRCVEALYDDDVLATLTPTNNSNRFVLPLNIIQSYSFIKKNYNKDIGAILKNK